MCVFDHMYEFLYMCVCVDVIVSVSVILKSAKVVVCVFFNIKLCKVHTVRYVD